jgi:hypothetical protein
LSRPVVSKAGGLDGDDLEAVEAVEDQGREDLALKSVGGDDHEGLAALVDLVEDGDEGADAADLVVDGEDVAVGEFLERGQTRRIERNTKGMREVEENE